MTFKYHLSAARIYSLHCILRRTNLFRKILISFFVDTWKISSYQWSTCPGPWPSAPSLPPSSSPGSCLQSSGILWCFIMVSSIFQRNMLSWINLQNAVRTSSVLYLMLDVQCSASYLLTLKAKNLSLPTFLHNKNSNVFVKSTKFS